MTANPNRVFLTLCLLLGLSAAGARTPVGDAAAYVGHWRINEELSDDTDHQVEVAIRAAGGRPPATGRKGRERYRGGPPEQELYDHLAYDLGLRFQYEDPEFRLVYDDSFERVFYSDRRTRVISASGNQAGDHLDYSFADWGDDRLIVESRPRDGGYIFETWTHDPVTDRLRVEMEMKPSSFARPIHIIRVYDRVPDPD